MDTENLRFILNSHPINTLRKEMSTARDRFRKELTAEVMKEEESIFKGLTRLKKIDLIERMLMHPYMYSHMKMYVPVKKIVVNKKKTLAKGMKKLLDEQKELQAQYKKRQHENVLLHRQHKFGKLPPPPGVKRKPRGSGLSGGRMRSNSANSRRLGQTLRTALRNQ